MLYASTKKTTSRRLICVIKSVITLNLKITSMKNIIALVILHVYLTPSLASNNDDKTNLESLNVQSDHNAESKNDEDTEYFDTLSKPNSDNKSILGFGNDKIDVQTKSGEICSVATTDDGKNGAGLCGVPVDKSEKETKIETIDEPS